MRDFFFFSGTLGKRERIFIDYYCDDYDYFYYYYDYSFEGGGEGSEFPELF